MQTTLEKRRSKVLGLQQIALSDKLPHKFIQAQFIISEIDSRICSQNQTRSVFLNQIRNNTA